MSDSLIAIKAIPLFVAAGLFAFLALPASQFVISVFPFLSYVQFPWRWLLMLPIACIVAFSAIKQPIPKVIQLFLIGAILMQMLIILRSTPADRFHRPNQYYEYFTMSTSTMNENLPKTFLYPEISEWEPTPIIAQGTASATVNYWKGSSRKYTLVAETDITVIEPTMYFSGWRTFVVNQETQKKSKVEYIDSKEIGGRIAYTLPKGSYQVKSAFSDLTLPRIIGDVLSILGIIFCIQWIGRLLLTKK